jgi:hypothetical protein
MDLCWSRFGFVPYLGMVLIRPKRPLDPYQLGKWIVDLSTGVAKEDHPAAEFRAPELARKAGLKSAERRTEAVTPERRREIARLAAQKRWARPKRSRM